jgi:hypothetical protein
MSESFDFYQEQQLIDGRDPIIEFIEQAERNFWGKCKLRPDGTRTDIPRGRPQKHKWLTLDEKRFENELEKLNKGKK